MTDLFPMKVGLSRGRPNRPRPRQAGAATLAVAVIMLLVVSVLVFHSHTAGWLEQRATTNQVRAKQALAAAEAGLEVALAALNDDTVDSNTLKPARERYLTPSNGNFSSTDVPLTGSFGNGLTYSVSFTASPSPANTFKIESTGESDCSNGICAGKATVSQLVRAIGFTRLPKVSSYSPPLSAAAFFESIFSGSVEEVRAMSTPMTSAASLSTSTSGLVWLEGTSTFTTNRDIGSSASPVLLVVAGHLTLDSGTVNGLVYVMGNLTICAACNIQGAVAVEGTIDSPANVTLDSAILGKLGTTAPRFAKVMGTWRDW